MKGGSRNMAWLVCIMAVCTEVGCSSLANISMVASNRIAEKPYLSVAGLLSHCGHCLGKFSCTTISSMVVDSLEHLAAGSIACDWRTSYGLR